MFEIAAIIGLGLLAFLFAYIAFQVEKDKAPLQLLFFCLSLFFVAGLLYAISDFSIQSQTPILLNTSEDSHYWNCTATEQDCFGEPGDWSCITYDETQCGDIDGCTWIAGGQPYCYGTPTWSCEALFDYGGETKCLETKGCYLELESNPQTCDSVVVTYNYGNQTDYSHQQSWYLTLYDVALLLIAFVIFYLIITIIISVFNMFWGKRDDGDE